MKTLKTLVASLSLATLVVGHSAVAATRSYSSLPSSGVSAPASVERVGASLGADENLGGRSGAGLIIAIFGSIAAFLAFLEAVGAIDIIGGDDDGDDSPG